MVRALVSGDAEGVDREGMTSKGLFWMSRLDLWQYIWALNSRGALCYITTMLPSEIG
jgi:hypothetical protein